MQLSDKAAMCADIETGGSSPGESEEPVSHELCRQISDCNFDVHLFFTHQSCLILVASLIQKPILSFAMSHVQQHQSCS